MMKLGLETIGITAKVFLARFLTAVQPLLGLVLFLSLSIAYAQPSEPTVSQVVPQYAPEQHQGVATCSSSTCHGSIQPRGSNNILQNEYITWSREDAHSGAYAVLLTPESQRIARKLGLPAAHTANVCLDCHTDNVPPALRGDKFLLTDGIGCEACHGGSENWLSSHVDGKADHNANIENGLYPTDQPAARATLCISCHIGTPEKFASHDIMGAGHPRLSFELTTFSALQPMHYQIDDDYRARKIATDDAKLWALGQIMAAKQTAENLANRKLIGNGLFPELGLFDCHACHHQMNQQRWAPNSARPTLGTGEIRVNDSQLTLVRPILAYFDLALAKRYLAQVQRIHAASTQSRGSLNKAASRLVTILNEAYAVVNNQAFDTTDSIAIMQQLSWRGGAGQYRDYAAAEHAAMGLQVLAVNAELDTQLKADIDRLFKALGNENSFAPYQANRAFKRMDATLKNHSSDSE